MGNQSFAIPSGGVKLKRRRDDLKVVREWKVMLGFAATFIGITAYVYTTFATINYVDIKHMEIVERIARLENSNARAFERIEDNQKIIIRLVEHQR